ncbi:D-aminoacyl-tRNA deacylase [Crassaminicella profunda]|uniref:D-aminoacyl-tRNA deacylase n=1 Tax=Crassaminicella profunda TaxID=1286698 RepID=UPI001CA7B3F8|nr:D-aminoacyl-tRNA deacylase [Crassaminicella profunda]QZY57048.1 D-tyrosyl-tRNA(Tyr) deacylase [Crassaminicella profunda]
MRAVIQRVKGAKVTVEGDITGKIDKGFLVLLGVEPEDDEKDLEYMVEKIVKLRIFEDEEEKMNLSLLDIKGEMLVVSQFTLLGDCRKGRRPNFMNAAKPDQANELYRKFVEKVKSYEIHAETGVFGAHMEVDLCNDGPVTILIDSKKNF